MMLRLKLARVPFGCQSHARFVCTGLQPQSHRYCFRQGVSKLSFSRKRICVHATGSEEEKEELPPWARNEELKKLGGEDLPFPIYLLSSAIVAIAAVGSIFEFANKNPIFNIIKPDSFLWAPILLLFGITGLPTSGYLFKKAIDSANAASERQDKVDGY